MLYYALITTLGALALYAIAMALVLFAMTATPRGRDWLSGTLGHRARQPIGWAWIVAAVAMSGSLYLSDVQGFVPCLFCWYQRIAMYPLVLVLGVGLLRGDPGVWRFALPLPIAGVMLSAYHVALQFQPALEIVECGTGAPCSARYVAVFGFISIPWMAGSAFLLIAALMLVLRVIETREGESNVESFLATG